MFRVFALIALAGAISVSGYHRRRARRSSGTIPRGREPGALKAGRAFVALPLFGSVLLYLSAPDSMAWATFGAPGWLRWLGVAAGLAAVGAVHWVLSNLGANVSETVLTKERHLLVTSGPYRWVRHPLYTVGIGLFVALGLMAANWFILLWATLALVAVHLAVIPREERALTEKFGESYLRYMTTTGRMLPRLASSPPAVRRDTTDC